jgi:hypothetical protein
MKLFAAKGPPDRVPIDQALGKLTEELVEELGDDLVAVIQYGDFIKESGFRVPTGPVNLMLVLRQISCQRLDKVAPLIARAERTIPLATMTLTEEDILTSCDVFPIKFHDMQRFHRLLAGRDVLSSLDITDDFLRLRCEQQLKNLMIRLRATYLHRNHSDSALVDTLCEAANHFLRDIAACMFLKTGIVPEDEHDLSEVFGREFEIDVSVMTEMLRLRDTRTIPNSQELRRVFDLFMKLVHDAAISVDEMESSS